MWQSALWKILKARIQAKQEKTRFEIEKNGGKKNEIWRKKWDSQLREAHGREMKENHNEK